MSIANKSSSQCTEEIDCPGDCNMGRPCQTCGSNGQYIGRVRVIPNNICGHCADFGPKGCMTSIHEAKFGNANTPACDEFKRKTDGNK